MLDRVFPNLDPSTSLPCGPAPNLGRLLCGSHCLLAGPDPSTGRDGLFSSNAYMLDTTIDSLFPART